MNNWLRPNRFPQFIDDDKTAVDEEQECSQDGCDYFGRDTSSCRVDQHGKERRQFLRLFVVRGEIPFESGIVILAHGYLGNGQSMN